jgi:hypothetical protein
VKNRSIGIRGEAGPARSKTASNRLYSIYRRQARDAREFPNWPSALMPSHPMRPSSTGNERGLTHAGIVPGNVEKEGAALLALSL